LQDPPKLTQIVISGIENKTIWQPCTKTQDKVA
jgi:hypothetical protein